MITHHGMQAEDLLTLALYIPRRFFFHTSFKKRLQPVCNQFYSRPVWCVAVVNWDWIRKSARSVFKIQIVDPREVTRKRTNPPEYVHNLKLTESLKQNNTNYGIELILPYCVINKDELWKFTVLQRRQCVLVQRKYGIPRT